MPVALIERHLKKAVCARFSEAAVVEHPAIPSRRETSLFRRRANFVAAEVRQAGISAGNRAVTEGPGRWHRACDEPGWTDSVVPTSESQFDILDLLSILQENRLIQPVNPGSSQCEACGRLHFRQWYRAPGGYRFYVCTVARHAMFQDLAAGWRLVTLHDLVRWLLSSLAAVRAA